MISYINTTIGVEFEGVDIIVSYNDFVSQPNREKTFSIEIYDGRGDIESSSAVYKFIETRFRQSELFNEIVTRFNIKNTK